MAIKFRDRIMAAVQAARSAYKKGAFNQEIDFAGDSDWENYSSRMLRYEVLEQYASNDPYDADVVKWAKRYKEAYTLYNHIRPIGNPAKRLVKFHKSHTWGGWLDPKAGAGSESALPIVTENENLRPHIAQLWKWSNWTTRRGDVVRDGTKLGDAFIQAIDDLGAKKVYLKSVHPSKVEDFVKDAYGNIKEYKISYMRTDDVKGNDKEVLYTEIAIRDGGEVVYSLFKNDKLHPWDGAEKPEWSVPYGFIPMVHIEHISTSSGWGESEMQGNLALFRELDEQRSMLNDQIRQVINYPIVVTGESAPSTDPSYSDSSDNIKKSAREEAPVFYLPNSDSKMEPLTSDLPIDAVRGNLEDLKLEAEDEYPELALKRMQRSSQVSGETIKRMQKPVARRIDEYRNAYDGALVNIMQMALTIGGIRKLFDGINADSYEKGELDFTIGKRPVFATDPMDDIEIKQGKAEVLSTMSNVGNLNAAVEYVYGEDSPLVGKLNQVDTDLER